MCDVPLVVLYTKGTCPRVSQQRPHYSRVDAWPVGRRQGVTHLAR